MPIPQPVLQIYQDNTTSSLRLEMRTRYSCNRLVWQSLKNGSKTMDTGMAELLGITIDSSHGEERTATQLSVSPRSSYSTSDIYIESLSIVASLSRPTNDDILPQQSRSKAPSTRVYSTTPTLPPTSPSGMNTSPTAPVPSPSCTARNSHSSRCSTSPP